jgi:hypothetical protein
MAGEITIDVFEEKVFLAVPADEGYSILHAVVNSLPVCNCLATSTDGGGVQAGLIIRPNIFKRFGRAR